MKYLLILLLAVSCGGPVPERSDPTTFHIHTPGDYVAQYICDGTIQNGHGEFYCWHTGPVAWVVSGEVVSPEPSRWYIYNGAARFNETVAGHYAQPEIAIDLDGSDNGWATILYPDDGWMLGHAGGIVLAY